MQDTLRDGFRFLAAGAKARRRRAQEFSACNPAHVAPLCLFIFETRSVFGDYNPDPVIALSIPDAGPLPEINIARWGELLRVRSSPSILPLKINPRRSLRALCNVRAVWEWAPTLVT